jgi:hypothetical protein
MDRFIKIVPQKKNTSNGTIHVEALERVTRLLSEHKNIFVCGPTGVGKTHLLRNVIDTLPCIEIQAKTTVEYLEETCVPVVIEDYDAEPLLYKNLIDHVVEHGTINGRSTIVTSISAYMLPNFVTVFIPPLTCEQLLTINSGPGSAEAASKAKGSVRNFLHYMEKYDHIDTFKTSKEYVRDILCTPEPFPWLDTLPEHGHICDTLQENYPDSKGADIVRIASSLSEADALDTKVYNGHWALLPYYVHSGIRTPKAYMGNTLDPDKVRTGSAWTKFGNFKMRFKKYNEIRRKSQNRLGVEEMCLLKRYAELGRYDRLLEYDLTPQDFDVMNHLASTTKLKQKDVTNVKKGLKHAIERRRRRDPDDCEDDRQRDFLLR